MIIRTVTNGSLVSSGCRPAVSARTSIMNPAFV